MMAHTERFGQNPAPWSATRGLSDNYRREELVRKIEYSLEHLTLQELEALYYDMSTRNFINE